MVERLVDLVARPTPRLIEQEEGVQKPSSDILSEDAHVAERAGNTEHESHLLRGPRIFRTPMLPEFLVPSMPAFRAPMPDGCVGVDFGFRIP